MVSLKELTCEELLRRIKVRDEAAFVEFVKRFSYRTVSFVARIRPYLSRQDSEEIVQDAFLRVWEKASSHNEGWPVEPWFLTIVRNLVFDFERKRVTKRRTLVGSLDFSAPKPQAPDEALLLHEQHEAVERAFDSLDDELRELMVGRIIYELSYKELAASYGLPESEVKVSLAKGRRQLRKFLSGYLELDFEASPEPEEASDHE